jgi:acetyl-CoA carboxylase carboxyltransferase component
VDLAALVPESERQAFDMRRFVKGVLDDGSYFEIQALWAREVTLGFGRLAGEVVGVVANNSLHKGGVLFVDSADKATRFVQLCDAFNVPLLFLSDVPGFMVGAAVEKQGIIRHGAKMLFAVSEATVPKISVVLRKSYGAGYFVMNGYAYEPDYLVAWPTAEVAVMGPDPAVNIIHRGTLDAVPEEERAQKRLELAEEIRKNIDPYIASGHGLVDDVIDPADTRLAIWRGLELSADKQIVRPWRKHGVLPV